MNGRMNHSSALVLPSLFCALFPFASSLQGCGQGCTEIGCIDQLDILIQAADGSERSYDATLLIDGEEITCPAPELDSTGACTDARVSVALWELTDCEETRTKDSVSQSCTPNGKYMQWLTIEDTPEEVHVVLSSADFPTVESTFTPKYSSSRPNGKHCPPQCHQATETWTVD